MNQQKNKIVVCGCHEAGWESIRFLLQNRIPIAQIVTITEEKAKKLNVSGFKSYEPLAKEYNIPIHYAETYSLKTESDVKFFEDHKFDLLISGGWQRLYPENVLKTLRVGAIGGHGSAEKLPKGRGRSPVNWSLIKGEKLFHMHYFLVKPGMDDGDIFFETSFDINEWDTCRTLYYKISITSRRMFLEWIPKLLSGDYQTRPQLGEPSYLPKRTPEDGVVDWNQSAEEIYNQVRALTHPYPGAFYFNNKNEKIFIWKAQPFDSKLEFKNAKPGDIVEHFETGDYLVQCGKGILLVKR